MLFDMAVEIQIAVDCADPERLAAWWADVLDYTVEHLPADGGERWCAIVDPAGAGPRVLFHRVPEPKREKNRLHLDVRAAGPRGTPKAERRAPVDTATARLTSRGATHLRTVEDDDDYFAVLQDPEGNEFCVC